MFVCNHCGELRENLETIKQNCGHTSLGASIDETLTIDECKCGGKFVEATECKVCGEWFDNSEMNNVCEVCFDEYETVGEALEIGAENTESIEGINGFVASVLSAEQINKILTKWVEENFTDHSEDVVKYCEEDKFYFSDYLADKYGE